MNIQIYVGKKNPDVLKAERFFKEWIPMENHYFDACKVRECSDFLLSKNE